MSGGGGSDIRFPPTILPPSYGFQSNFMNDWLPQMVGQTSPSFQGFVDPGQSPTTQAWINSSQQFATSPQQYLAGAEGVLGNVLGGASGGPSSYGPTASDYSLNRFMFPGSGAAGPLGPQPRDLGYGYGSHAGAGPGGGLFSPPSPSPGPGMAGPGAGFGGPGGYPGGGGGPSTGVRTGQGVGAPSQPTNELAGADRPGTGPGTPGPGGGPPGLQPGLGGVGQQGSQNFRWWNVLPASQDAVHIGMPYIQTAPWGSQQQQQYQQIRGHRGFSDWNPGAGVLPIQGRDVGNFAQPSRGWNYQNPLGNQGGGGGGGVPGGGGGAPGGPAGPGPGGTPPGGGGGGGPGGGPGIPNPGAPDDFDPTGGSGGYPGGGKVPMPSTYPGGSASSPLGQPQTMGLQRLSQQGGNSMSSLSPQMQAIMRGNSQIANQFGFGSPGQQPGGMQTQGSQGAQAPTRDLSRTYGGAGTPLTPDVMSQLQQRFPTMSIAQAGGGGPQQGGMSNLMFQQQGNPGQLQSLFQQLQQQGGANLSGAFGGGGQQGGNPFGPMTERQMLENQIKMLGSGIRAPNAEEQAKIQQLQQQLNGLQAGGARRALDNTGKPTGDPSMMPIAQLMQNAQAGGGGNPFEQMARAALQQGGGPQGYQMQTNQGPMSAQQAAQMAQQSQANSPFMAQSGLGGGMMNMGPGSGGAPPPPGPMQQMGQQALAPGGDRNAGPGTRPGAPGTPRPDVPPAGSPGREGVNVPPLTDWRPAAGTTDFQGFYDAAQNRVKDDIRKGVDQQLQRSGFSGNRYSSSAQEGVGRVVGDAYNKLGEDFAGISYQHGRDDAGRQFSGVQNELNRALQATGMGQQADQFFAQLASQNRNRGLDRQMQGVNTMLDMQRLQDQGMQGRLGALQGAAGAEQGRADAYNRLSYDDFINSRWGTLPMMQGFMGGGGSPAQPNPIAQQRGPSGWDYAMQAAGMAAMLGAAFSDERLKDDVKPLGRIGPVEFKSWRWKHSGEPGAGVMAQQIEKLDPSAVRTDPTSGIKMVDKARTFDLILDGLRAESAKRVGGGRGRRAA